ncbi:raffinose/stachyose/melibiose transport system permease protein [Diaminobutyricimonas aerilata]|uniref:Raffinose/stachyose/melibiose transport system permease protein n=1 Tax=Diaminobutyricimonas aerilata TaxID=1162967 RepID=A0A2M9CJL2_9MICO|nr:sugar ABC transporter permease [Diaminobutyricimonas aerilata]PJJ72086.1 raffinose/stachyose/melibiose transport system permease protein [Diaminobutyricimonas aerilata]
MTVRAVEQQTALGSRRTHRRASRFRGASINLLYLPALVLFAVFTVYPLISGVALSFTDWDGYSPQRAWVAAENYVRLLTDDTFRSVLGNTFIYGIGSTAIQQVIGLGLALALDRRLRGRNVARAIIYLPVLVSPIVMGTFYYLLFQYDNGALNDLVVALGGQRQAWLSTAAGGITTIVLVNSVQFVGTSMIIYLAGLQAIAPEYTEAAMLDGANAWQRFWSVTLPLLQPAFATSVILNLIGGLKLFDVIQVLTGGGPGTSTSSVSTLIGTTYFANQAAGYSAAMGVALFAIIAVLTVIANAALNRRRLEQQ